VRRRDDDVAADELAPVHVVAEGRREQAQPVAALLEQAVGLLEHRHAGPLEHARIHAELVLLGVDLQPVVEAAHHDRAHRAHRADVLALALAPLQAALERLGDLDALRQREAHRGVDADAAVGRFLDGRDARARDGDLDDDVGRELREVLGLPDDRLGIAVEPRVGLHRQPAVAPAVRLEDGLQERGGGHRQLVDDRSRRSRCSVAVG
jgi:hypothetical protein